MCKAPRTGTDTQEMSRQKQHPYCHPHRKEEKQGDGEQREHESVHELSLEVASPFSALFSSSEVSPGSSRTRGDRGVPTRRQQSLRTVREAAHHTAHSPPERTKCTFTTCESGTSHAESGSGLPTPSRESQLPSVALGCRSCSLFHSRCPIPSPLLFSIVTPVTLSQHGACLRFSFCVERSPPDVPRG